MKKIFTRTITKNYVNEEDDSLETETTPITYEVDYSNKKDQEGYKTYKVYQVHKNEKIFISQYRRKNEKTFLNRLFSDYINLKYEDHDYKIFKGKEVKFVRTNKFPRTQNTIQLTATAFCQDRKRNITKSYFVYSRKIQRNTKYIKKLAIERMKKVAYYKFISDYGFPKSSGDLVITLQNLTYIYYEK